MSEAAGSSEAERAFKTEVAGCLLADVAENARRIENARTRERRPPEAPETAAPPAPPGRGAAGGSGETYDYWLEWLIRSGDAAMGMRGTMAGVVSQIERGSVGGTSNLDARGCYKHPYTDLQLGEGDLAIGEIETHRYLTAAWRKVSPRAQATLATRYTAPHAEFRADQGFGAKDRYVKGSDARVGQHSPTRTGVEDALGQYAALAFELSPDPRLLFLACVEPEPVRKGKVNRGEASRRRLAIVGSLALAHAADAEAHAEWFEARASVPKPRNFKERVGRERCRLSTVGERQVGRAARSGRAMRMGDAAFVEAMARALEVPEAAE